jgi:hypothetical protein
VSKMTDGEIREMAAAIEEMFTLNRGGLANLGRVLDQVGPAWDAQAEVTRQLAAAPEDRP